MLNSCKKAPLCQLASLQKISSQTDIIQRLPRLTTCNQRRNFLSGQHDSYDAIVCGGGMIGTVMACALGKSKFMEGKKILLVDSGKPVGTEVLDNPGNFGLRVCAISPGSIKFLEQIGVWQHVPRSKIVEQMQVWDACSESRISFSNTELTDGSQGVCSITENHLIVSAAMKNLMSNTNVETKFGVKISDCDIPSEDRDYTRPQKLASLTLSDGSVVSSKLIIAADGLNSFLRQRLNIPKVGWDYGSNAVVATLQLSEPCENNTSWQRFLPTGPIALLPLSNEQSSLVWSTTPKEAEMLCQCSPDELATRINDAFWENLSQNELVSSAHYKVKQLISMFGADRISVQQYPPSISDVIGGPQHFPLGLSHCTWYMKSRIAFIGDTVHRIHPLAGQGANMGYRDVKNLIKAIEEAVYQGRDIGSISTLKKFESQSQKENLPILFVTDAMKRLYSTDFWPVVMLRSSGLELTNAITPLKNFLKSKAMS